MNGSQLIAQILEQYGVDKSFGNPGTTELPIIDAVDKSSEIDYIMALHEDVAVGAASGYSSIKRYRLPDEQVNRALSLVSLHVTPGLAHGLSNLYGAHFAGSPMIVTTGSQSDDIDSRNPPLSGDRVKLAEDYTKWSKRIKSVDDIPSDFRKAARKALEPPTGPVFLDIPMDVQNSSTDQDVEPLGNIPKRNSPEDSVLDEATEILANSDVPVIVVGNQLAHRGKDVPEALVEIAEKIGARIHGEALMSEISVPTTHPQWSYILGLHQKDMEPLLDTDTVVYVGCKTESPLFGDDVDNMISESTQVMHIGYDMDCIGRYHEDGYFVTGDIKESIFGLRNRLKGYNLDRDNSEKIEQIKTRMDKERAESIPTSPDRLSSMDVANAIDNVLDDGVLSEEAVTAGFVLRNTASLDYGQLIGQKSGGLGYGLPASVGIAIAEEETKSPRNVICYVGDGSYQYYPQTLYTAKRYVDESLSIIVPENGGYEILRSADVVEDKSPTTDESLSFDSQGRIAMNAESYGVRGNVYNYDEKELEEVIADEVESCAVTLLEVPIAFD
jgi:benzoylformate decarboxylase